MQTQIIHHRKGIPKMITQYYTAIIMLSVFSMVTMLLCLHSTCTLSKKERHFFQLEFCAIALSALCEWAGVMLQGTGPSTRGLHIAVKVIEFSIAPLAGLMFSWTLEHRRNRILSGILIANACLEFLSGFTGFIFYVDSQSTYFHGDFYWIYTGVYAVSILYTLRTVSANARKNQSQGTSFVISTIVFLFGGILIQAINSELRVDYLVLSITAIMLFCYTQAVTHQTDALTGLLNRRGYENYITRVDEPCLILFFDVNHFKQINDTYGHAQGDECLKLTGQALKEVYGKYGKCFRIGGDEFCVILTSTVKNVVQLNAAFSLRMKELRKDMPPLPTVSLGYTAYDPEKGSLQEALELADQKMYRYKQQVHAGEHTETI